MYNLLVGGAAGQGVDTAVAILERLLKQSGCGIFATRDLMSRIRGGHNFSLVRFGEETPGSHSDRLDGIIALNEETVAIHSEDLQPDGFILCDSAIKTGDARAIKLDMAAIAKDLGDGRAAGSVAVGAVLKLFGMPLDEAKVYSVFEKSVKPDHVEINVKAAQAGYSSVPQKFERAGGDYSDHMILSGNKALALGALTAGLQFYSAYPMSPSTSIMEYLALKAEETGIVVEQAEDEIAAVNMAVGASFTGARAMTGTSGGGFSLMVEALGLSGMTEIPLVLVNVQRPGPVTGFPTRTEQGDLKFMISASQGEFPRMVIALRHHEDAYYQTVRAFNMAEKYQIPVILLSDQYLADSTATIPVLDPFKVKLYEPPEDSPGQGEYLRYRYTGNGISPRKFPGTRDGFVSADSDEHDERGYIVEDSETRVRMMDKRMGKLALLAQELQEPELLGDQDPEVLLLGWGSMYGPLEEAVRLLNRKAGKNRYSALVFGDLWPLPQRLLKQTATSARFIVNVEQNYMGQLALLIREVTGIKTDASILKYDGRQLSGEEIVARVVREGF
ncbi:MAG TPA: 2-oxoacid:acceptor oxidoreductase subunit alpha [Anaerovoracaceae bacterium]|nr:2-oxoacid:acceptor oxidoreductase subunit alpha [Anaerovoracaceae bacterium]